LVHDCRHACRFFLIGAGPSLANGQTVQAAAVGQADRADHRELHHVLIDSSVHNVLLSEITGRKKAPIGEPTGAFDSPEGSIYEPSRIIRKAQFIACEWFFHAQVRNVTTTGMQAFRGVVAVSEILVNVFMRARTLSVK
jgi:hypothetical protein